MLWTLIKNVARKALHGAGDAAGNAALKAGMACFNAGEFDAARRHLSAALAAAPDDFDALYYLGLAEARSGHLDAAQRLLQAAHAQRDHSADLHNALGNVHRLRGQPDEAVASYRRALEWDGDHVAALVNLGSCLRDQGRPEEALVVLEHAQRLAPHHVDAMFNKALALIDTAESEPAFELLERTLELDPDFAEAHTHLGFLLLRRGDFAAGWREYAWRVRTPDWSDQARYPYREWQGEPLSGKSILVRAEQGLGDQIMFASCLPQVVSRARRTIIESDPRLAKLFARSFPAAAVYRHRSRGDPDWLQEQAPDFQVYCGDLPRVLRNRNEDFPRHDGYLEPDPALMAAWRARLAELGPGINIGISWRGGTPRTRQTARSLALDALLPVLSLPGVNFVSLQYGQCSDEIASLRTRHGVRLHEWPQAIADMDELAALIGSLNLVITVCTTVAHLSGALAQAAWVMVPVVAEWRYLEHGATLPWYPALRLFRQQRRNEWSDVIAAVRVELQQRFSPSSAGA